MMSLISNYDDTQGDQVTFLNDNDQTRLSISTWFKDTVRDGIPKKQCLRCGKFLGTNTSLRRHWESKYCSERG